MIQETCLEIEVLSERHERERLERYARRTKIQEIDELLNEFEMSCTDGPFHPGLLTLYRARLAERRAFLLH